MKMLTRVLACMAIVTIACGTLLAAQQPSMAIAKGHGTIVPYHVDAKLKTIFNNLGSGSTAYDSTNGWLVMGSANTYFGYEQFIAMPFTPKKNAHATKVSTSMTYYGVGTNSVTIALFSDSAGLPGNSLKAADAKNLPTFGTCCTVTSVKLGKGVKVKKGKQYWAVGEQDSTNSDAVNVWNYVYGDGTGPFAFNQGSGWNAYTSTLCGYGVFGTIP